ncbi:MAG: DNA polymerase III subunit delta [Tissierellia bacterium]|nr:DNA polymerase III subunit delta [Tissierellia bacterium]
MKYLEFMNDIKTKAPEGAYIFYGYEIYLLENTIEYLRKEYIAKGTEDFNYISLQGKLSSTKDIVNACETMPFMSEKKIVIVENVDEFIAANDLTESFYEYIVNLKGETILIFKDNTDDLNKNLTLYRRLKKINKNVEFAKLNNIELRNFINKYFNKLNKKITANDLLYYINKSSYLNRNAKSDLFQIKNDLDKMAAFATGEIIDRENIDKNTEIKYENNIFKLIDSLSSKNIKLAIYNFDELYRVKESPIKIMYMIVRHFRNLYHIRILSSKGYTDLDIMKKLGIKNFEYRKLKSIRTYSDCELVDILKLLNETDIALKTSSIDERLLIERLIVRICA